MAISDNRISVELDADMVSRARAELGLERESDTAVVERALNAYLLGRLVDGVQGSTGLSDEEVEALAYEELHASRRERGAA